MYPNIVVDIFSTTAIATAGSVGHHHLSKHEFVKTPLSDLVGAHQRMDGHPVLSQPPRVFQRRCGGLDLRHIDVVAHGVQHDVDVGGDAGSEQVGAERVAGEVRDLLLEITLDDRCHVG